MRSSATAPISRRIRDEANGKLFDTVFPLLGFALRFGSYLIMWFGNLMLFNGVPGVGELNQFNTYASILYAPLMQITQIPVISPPLRPLSVKSWRFRKRSRKWRMCPTPSISTSGVMSAFST